MPNLQLLALVVARRAPNCRCQMVTAVRVDQGTDGAGQAKSGNAPVAFFLPPVALFFRPLRSNLAGVSSRKGAHFRGLRRNTVRGNAENQNAKSDIRSIK